MTQEQRAKLQDAARLIREVLGDATQLDLIIDQTPNIANLRSLRPQTIQLMREAFQRYLHDWIDIHSIEFKSMMGRNGVLDLSQFIKICEGRGIVDVHRTADGVKSRFIKFRFIQKIPI